MEERGVPYALMADGSLADPEVVSGEEQCTCLNCGKAVLLRRGESNRAHFAHLAHSTCSKESVRHLAAKKRLQAFFLQHLNSPLMVQWRMPCQGQVLRTPQGTVKKKRCPEKSILWEGLQLPVFDGVKLEHDEGYVADVALLHQGGVVFWLEVHHAHRVPQEKAASLAFPWAEMSAQAVLEDPENLTLLDFHAPPRQCLACQQAEQRHLIRQRRLEDQQRCQEAPARRAVMLEAPGAGAAERHQADWTFLNERYGEVFPFVRRYFEIHQVNVRQHPGQMFFVTKCTRCRRGVVFFETRDRIEGVFALKHLIHIEQKPSSRRWGKDRLVFTNKCVHCGEKHHMHWVDRVRHDPTTGRGFKGQDFMAWLEGHPGQSAKKER